MHQIHNPPVVVVVVIIIVTATEFPKSSTKYLNTKFIITPRNLWTFIEQISNYTPFNLTIAITVTIATKIIKSVPKKKNKKKRNDNRN